MPGESEIDRKAEPIIPGDFTGFEDRKTKRGSEDTIFFANMRKLFAGGRKIRMEKLIIKRH
jgi:hypothetical protein